MEKMNNGYNQGVQLAALRESIRRSFPAEPYSGQITPTDGAWIPELDDDRKLYDALHGRDWTELPRTLLYDQPDGYVLLTDRAFQAFLPAWLMCSLENIDGENRIRDFLIYAFSPKHDMVPDTTELIVKRLRILSAEQRLTIRALLTQFAHYSTSSFHKRLAAAAIELIGAFE